ncbi:hypothetical protein FXV75_10000 [Marinomonas sp. IMCC 4694]|nr:hypothetical protein FXV75_10000 [Marinomonas sp. IMCC 4694]
MTVISRMFVVSVCLGGYASAESVSPNFAFGLGYGLLNEQSLMNIDFKINIPINDSLSTQVLLNSNYHITGSTTSTFAQSELSSNWFLNNDHGRLGAGLGISELEYMDARVEKQSDVILQIIGEAFVGNVSLTTNYVSTQMTLSNITSSRIGVGYYFTDNLRSSIYREKYNGDSVGWRLETAFQPAIYHKMGSLNVIFRTSREYDYAGIMAEYYFDYAVSLKQREREFH